MESGPREMFSCSTWVRRQNSRSSSSLSHYTFFSSLCYIVLVIVNSFSLKISPLRFAAVIHGVLFHRLCHYFLNCFLLFKYSFKDTSYFKNKSHAKRVTMLFHTIRVNLSRLRNLSRLNNLSRLLSTLTNLSTLINPSTLTKKLDIAKIWKIKEWF